MFLVADRLKKNQQYSAKNDNFNGFAGGGGVSI
jgi:hypothetical protein